MRRPALRVACAVASALALGGGGPVPSAVGWSVVAADAGGAVVAARPLRPGGGFALAYVHSAYHAPAVELFTAAGSRFTMSAVTSPSEAVLDYYAVAGNRSPVSGWWVLRPDRPQVFDELPLIATPTGRRMLVAGSDCVPLYPASGASELRIGITQGRLVAGRAAPCPG